MEARKPFHQPTTISSTYEELHRAQIGLYHNSLNAAGPMSIKCAVELGIHDAIHRVGGGGQRPVTFRELTAAMAEVISPAKLPYISRLIRLLVQLDFLATTITTNHPAEKDQGSKEEDAVGYLLTPFSQFLLKSNPNGMHSYYTYTHDPSFWPWQGLSEWFRRDDTTTAFEVAHGKAVWDFFRENPEAGRKFNEAMRSESRMVLDSVVRICADVFQGIGSLVDVGGGIGAAAMAIAKAFPAVKCSVLDLPHVIADAAAVAAAAASDNNIGDGIAGAYDDDNGSCSRRRSTQNHVSFIAGDMFQHVPPAEAILLKSILHDWDDADCVKILKRCKESISATGGKLIIIDAVLDFTCGDEKFREAQMFFDLLMMSSHASKERDEEEWRNILIEAAGFTSFNIRHVIGIKYLIEVFP